MKRSLLLVLALSGCVHQPYQPMTIADRIAAKCAQDGFPVGTLDHDECVQAASDAYVAEIVRLKKEQEAQEKKRVADQLKADEKKCKSYGINRGTKDFSACMMQIEASRDAKAEQDRQYEIEKQKANAEEAYMQEQVRLEKAKIIHEITKPAPATFYPMQGLGGQTNCTSYRQGIYTHTNCY